MARHNKAIHDDPWALWLDVGDKGEYITPDDPRYDPEKGVGAKWMNTSRVAFCVDKRFKELHRPILDQKGMFGRKALGFLWGNHEDKFRTHKHADPHQDLCDTTGIPNLGTSCWIIFNFRRVNSTESHQIKCVFAHGTGGAVTKGWKLNNLHKFVNNFPGARIYGQGHIHDVLEDVKPFIAPDQNGKLKQTEAVMATTGCWFRTYHQGNFASYGEKKLYPPTTIGAIMYDINLEDNSIATVKIK